MRDFIYNLFVKHFLPKHSLTMGEYVKDLADNMYRIEAAYYNDKLQPFYLAVDQYGGIRSLPAYGIEKIPDEDF